MRISATFKEMTNKQRIFTPVTVFIVLFIFQNSQNVMSQLTLSVTPSFSSSTSNTRSITLSASSSRSFSPSQTNFFVSPSNTPSIRPQSSSATPSPSLFLIDVFAGEYENVYLCSINPQRSNWCSNEFSQYEVGFRSYSNNKCNQTFNQTPFFAATPYNQMNQLIVYGVPLENNFIQLSFTANSYLPTSSECFYYYQNYPYVTLCGGFGCCIASMNSSPAVCVTSMGAKYQFDVTENKFSLISSSLNVTTRMMAINPTVGYVGWEFGNFNTFEPVSYALSALFSRCWLNG